MTLEEIRELIKLVSETGVAELEVQRGDNRVRIRQAITGETNVLMPSGAALAPIEPGGTGQRDPNLPVSSPVSSQKEAVPAVQAQDTLNYVKSPIVGTFYESASPDSPPFVQIGDHVTPGKVLCIIESMKLMNEIEADMAGVVESRLAQNGQPVEYGEALFGIRPV
jgi:acetyl-CoA carboxylase biotin carboxyl carrier protein